MEQCALQTDDKGSVWMLWNCENFDNRVDLPNKGGISTHLVNIKGAPFSFHQKMLKPQRRSTLLSFFYAAGNFRDRENPQREKTQICDWQTAALQCIVEN